MATIKFFPNITVKDNFLFYLFINNGENLEQMPKLALGYKYMEYDATVGFPFSAWRLGTYEIKGKRYDFDGVNWWHSTYKETGIFRMEFWNYMPNSIRDKKIREGLLSVNPKMLTPFWRNVACILKYEDERISHNRELKISLLRSKKAFD